jgi:hypothetical protein
VGRRSDRRGGALPVVRPQLSMQSGRSRFVKAPEGAAGMRRWPWIYAAIRASTLAT